MPAVTVKLNSRGLPIASTHSPTRAESELPHCSAVALRDGCGIGVAATAAAGWGDTIDAAALVCFGRLSVDANASPNTNAIATRVPNFSQSRVRTDIAVSFSDRGYFFLSSSTIS